MQAPSHCCSASPPECFSGENQSTKWACLEQVKVLGFTAKKTWVWVSPWLCDLQQISYLFPHPQHGDDNSTFLKGLLWCMCSAWYLVLKKCYLLLSLLLVLWKEGGKVLHKRCLERWKKAWGNLASRELSLCPELCFFFFFSELWFLNCGPRTSNIPWELVRDVNSQAIPQTNPFRNSRGRTQPSVF